MNIRALESRTALLLAMLFVGVASHAQVATNNPVAAFYNGPEGYPAWTDAIRWQQFIDMSKYAEGKNNFEKFEHARDELAANGGGVLYYPAGNYDFSTMPADGPQGRGLMLSRGVVICGETPLGKATAASGMLDLPTKFTFGFQRKGVDAAHGFGGDAPRDWNVIGLMPEPGGQLKDVNHVGICWVHVVGAVIYFGPQLKWGPTWGTAEGWKSKFVKAAWKERVPNGTSPLDPLLGAPFGKANYVGAGQGRLVFGCVLEDAAVLNDVYEEGNGPASFYAYKFGARIGICGSRVFVANNVLPISKRNFKYTQTTRKTDVGKGGGSMILREFVPDTTILFDYGKTCGVEVNKLLCGPWESGADQEGVIVRDNWVFNHGHRGFNLAGTWMTIANNRNERIYLKGGADVYGLGEGWTLTLDGNLRSNAGGNGTISDNLSRAFDLAGSHLWIDRNWFNNVGSNPGNDGEGILCQAHGGTQIRGWAITNNTHVKGDGQSSYMGAWDVDQHGCLIAWNQTAGWVGVINVSKRDEVDCAYVANKAAKVNAKNPETLTELPAGTPAAPRNVRTARYGGDAVRITWPDASTNEIGFGVQRSLDSGKTWTTIACRPPRINGTDPDGLAWIDFSAPPGKALLYRVAALAGDEAQSSVSEPAAALTLDPLQP
ncbi:MAG: hypothetical protein NTW87_10000 [Planctomycetota bacterium]|nr:hypothetical protein [Planctomycetota bacterium]